MTKSVEGVLGIQLRRSVPVEALLLGGTGHGLSVGAGELRRRVLRPSRRPWLFFCCAALVGDELDILILQAEILDGLADQVAVLLADVAEVRIGHAHEQDRSLRMTEARRLEPGLVGMAVDFFFQRIKNEHPRIGRGSIQKKT